MEQSDVPRDRRREDGALASLREELASVNARMLDISERLVTTSQVEERVQEAEQKEMAGRRQLALAIAVAVLIVAVLGGISVIQVASTNRTVRLIESCTIVGGECYTRLAQQGTSGITRNAQYIKCLLLIPPQERTESNMNVCFDKWYGDLIRGSDVPQRGGGR